MAKIKIVNGGIYTTVQDYGRIGYQKFGITASGVMDEYSYELANALCGNERGTAVLEMTYFGPMVKFEDDIVIAITGADMNPKIDNQPVNMYESILVKAGSTLAFGKLKSGVRGYLAFGGEINVDPVNGSKSTLAKNQIGGYMGRNLKAGDELEILTNSNSKEGKILLEKYIPKMEKFNVLRVVLGPQDDYFDEENINKFFKSGGYSLTRDIDRMGIRLEGFALKHKDGADIISDGAAKGAIQVPSNGKPIILMVDRQTTGGYTKIGSVVKEDVCKVAQMAPADKLCFQKVTIEEAQDLYQAYENKIGKIRESLI